MSARKVFLVATLGGLLLLAGLLPLFAILCRVEVSEPGGWFAQPATYTLIEWGRAWSWSFLAGLFGAGVLYGSLRTRRYYKNAIPRLLETGRFGDAWRMGVEFDEFTALEAHIRKQSGFMGEGLGGSIRSALEHLRRLRAAAADPLNPALAAPLRASAAGHSEKGLFVLGEIVGRLDLLERQKINPEKIRHRLDGIQRTVEHLAETTEAARVQLAGLSLGAERDDGAEEAAALMRQVSRAAEDLHQYDNAMSGIDSAGGDSPARIAE